MCELALSLSVTPLADCWEARELIGARWGEEGGVSLGRYQLIGPSVSPSLSDSSCISSVFPESLLADELMEREFLEEKQKKIYSNPHTHKKKRILTRDKMNRKSNLS